MTVKDDISQVNKGVYILKKGEEIQRRAVWDIIMWTINFLGNFELALIHGWERRKRRNLPADQCKNFILFYELKFARITFNPSKSLLLAFWFFINSFSSSFNQTQYLSLEFNWSLGRWLLDWIYRLI